MTRPLLLIGAFAGVVATASDALAQDRRGFWLSIGVSAGSGSCSQIDPLGNPRCSIARQFGPTASVAVGGTMSQQVFLGVEANGWLGSSADTARQFGIVTAMTQIFPARSLPLYLKVGLGVGRYAEDPESDDLLAGTGFGYLLGAGWDMPLTESMSLSPFLQYVLAPNLRAKLGRLNQLQDPLDYNLLHLGVGVRWR